MNNVLIRADSSSTIGTGHIMRDLVLARQFKGSNVSFACQNLTGNLNEKVKENNYVVHILESDSIEELIALVVKEKINTLVIDHYGIDFEDERKIKSKTDVSIFVLDDTYEKHCCDVLLNHNVCADKNKYKKLVPNHCEVRCGSQYTLLRQEFYKEKNKNYNQCKINNLTQCMVVMGGADHSNINTEIIKALSPLDGLKLNIVTTTSNKNIADLLVLVKGKSNLFLHINTTNIAKLMRQMDFAIITPSVIMNEVMYMNLPFVAIKTAQNQQYMYKYLERNSYLVLENYNEKKLIKLVLELLNR